MVVISHIGVIERKYGFPGQNILGKADIGQAGADLFFVISGFIMVVSMATRFGIRKSVEPFLLRRFIRIFPIYWLYLLVICLAMGFKPEWVNASMQGEGGTNFLSSFLLLPAPGAPILLVDWSLKYEVFFYLIFALLLLLPFKRLLPILTILFGFLLLWGGIGHPKGFLSFWITRPYLMEFLFGVILGHLHIKKYWGFGWLLISMGVAIWLFDTQGPPWNPTIGLGKPFLERPLFLGIPAALLLYGFVSLEQTKSIRFHNIFLRIGDASYSLYLSQVLFISACGRLWVELSLNKLPVNYILVLLTLPLAILCGWLSYAYVEKPIIDYLQQRWLKNVKKPIVKMIA
jgi:exopolysaccharide production protein ExoZ